MTQVLDIIQLLKAKYSRRREAAQSQDGGFGLPNTSTVAAPSQPACAVPAYLPIQLSLR